MHCSPAGFCLDAVLACRLCKLALLSRRGAAVALAVAASAAAAATIWGMGGAASSPAALRARRRHAASGAAFAGRHALVGGGTAGIGRGAALRLAEAGFSVTVLGRSQEHGAATLAELRARGAPGATHAFVPLDAFSLARTREAARAYAAALPRGAGLDVLFLSQGMATLAGRRETAEGLDEKMTLHFYSRTLLARELLPELRAAREPLVISVLSAGVHAPYAGWREDPELRDSYSLKNAADAAGTYNDLALDALARAPGNERIAFVHAAPGMVASSWGSELPAPLRVVVRALLATIGRSPADAAEVLLDPLWAVHAEAAANGGVPRGGLRLLGSDGSPAAPTAIHEAARDAVWAHTTALLDRVLETGHAR